MMNIRLDDPTLEESINKLFGSDERRIAQAFSEFLFHHQLKEDIGISIEQLDAGKGESLKEAMQTIRDKYE
ncbi:MAG: hypothetical protein ACQETD_08770 [Pseudomonadota bacterium]